MSATSALENEDLENVALVRMEDVQPDRYEDSNEDSDDGSDIIKNVVIRDEVLETCVVDSVGSDCVVNDEDGNVVVTIHAEVFDGDTSELIVSDRLEPPLDEPLEYVKEEEVDVKPKVVELEEPKPTTPGGWPTLEILPGGVIKHADKYDKELDFDETTQSSGEMMYVCAKCSQSFKYLFCLVKHVKWHEDQQKKLKGQDVTKIVSVPKECKDYVCLHSKKRKILSKIKSRCKVLKKKL